MLTLHRRLAAAILLYVLAPLAAFAQTADRWYVVEMMGGKAGWMHTFDLETDTTVTTTSKTHFSLARGGAGLSITIESEFVEGRDGKPISMKAVQKLGKTYTRRVDQLPPAVVLADIDAKVDFAKMEQTLMEEGLKKFADPQKALTQFIATKRAELGNA